MSETCVGMLGCAEHAICQLDCKIHFIPLDPDNSGSQAYKSSLRVYHLLLLLYSFFGNEKWMKRADFVENKQSADWYFSWISHNTNSCVGVFMSLLKHSFVESLNPAFWCRLQTESEANCFQEMFLGRLENVKDLKVDLTCRLDDGLMRWNVGTFIFLPIMWETAWRYEAQPGPLSILPLLLLPIILIMLGNNLLWHFEAHSVPLGLYPLSSTDGLTWGWTG